MCFHLGRAFASVGFHLGGLSSEWALSSVGFRLGGQLLLWAFASIFVGSCLGGLLPRLTFALVGYNREEFLFLGGFRLGGLSP